MGLKTFIRTCLSAGTPAIKKSEQERIVDDFHRLYYHTEEQTWKTTRWLGVSLHKCPLDLWIYQEIIFDQRPDLIIETGTLFGGSAFYLATILDLVGQGRIVSIDIEQREGRPSHERTTYLTGSSVDKEILSQVEKMAADAGKVMVILDSDHSKKHVAAELEAYKRFVTPGCYLVVEDTNVNGHPVFAGHGQGPMEAVEEFLQQDPEFVADREKEKYFLTFNPKGFLKKSRGA
jgi:cephalosporin hydroxylase